MPARTLDLGITLVSLVQVKDEAAGTAVQHENKLGITATRAPRPRRKRSTMEVPVSLPKSKSGTKLDQMAIAMEPGSSTPPAFGRSRTLDSLFNCVFNAKGEKPSPAEPGLVEGGPFSYKKPEPTRTILLSDLYPESPGQTTKRSLSSGKLSSLSSTSLAHSCKSVASQISKGSKMSFNFLEEMGNAVFAPRSATPSSSQLTSPGTSTTTRPSLTSQAVESFSKILTDRIQVGFPEREQEEREYPPHPEFFQMIRFNPADPNERLLFDEKSVAAYVRKHPDALKAKYDFSVGGRGNLTVNQYPLSALVALGASLPLVRFAIKTNPFALKATKEFGTTVLHTACSFDTDLEVLQFIYSKNRDAIRATTRLVYLPLHNACVKKNPSKQIIEFLIDEYPQALLAINKLGDTPLRAAQRNKTASEQVLDHLEAETKLVASLAQYQEVWKDVEDRQSWGSNASACTESEPRKKSSFPPVMLPTLKPSRSSNDARAA